MPLVVDSTSAGASANSYGSLVEAEAYVLGYAGTTTWADEDDDLKNLVLVAACSRLEQESYLGTRYTTTQALKWPREGIEYDGECLDSDVIPSWVKAAQFEEALSLLAKPDKYGASSLAAFENLKVGSIDLTPRLQQLSPSALSPAAERLLAPARVGGAGQFGWER